MVGVFHAVARKPFRSVVAERAPAGLELAVGADSMHANGHFDLCSAEFLQPLCQQIQRAAAVTNVVDDQDVSSCDGSWIVQCHLDALGDHAVLVGLVRTTAAKGGLHGDRASEQEVGKKEDSAPQDAKSQRLPATLGPRVGRPVAQGQAQLVDLPADIRRTGKRDPMVGDLSAADARVVVFQEGLGVSMLNLPKACPTPTQLPRRLNRIRTDGPEFSHGGTRVSSQRLAQPQGFSENVPAEASASLSGRYWSQHGSILALPCERILVITFVSNI